MTTAAADQAKRAEQTWNSAQDFLIASQILESRFGQPVFPMRATITTAALAIELTLKALLLRTTGEAPRDHRLDELFDLLPVATRDAIRTSYVRSGVGLPPLDELLREVANTFTRWRYIHESIVAAASPISFNFRAFAALAESAADAMRRSLAEEPSQR